MTYTHGSRHTTVDTDDFDMDAYEAALAEAKGAGWSFTYKGERFTTTPELSIEVLDQLAAAQRSDDGMAMMAAVVAAGQVVLGDQWERFKALGPSQSLLEKVLEGAIGGEEKLPEGSASSS